MKYVCLWRCFHGALGAKSRVLLWEREREDEVRWLRLVVTWLTSSSGLWSSRWSELFFSSFFLVLLYIRDIVLGVFQHSGVLRWEGSADYFFSWVSIFSRSSQVNAPLYIPISYTSKSDYSFSIFCLPWRSFSHVFFFIFIFFNFPDSLITNNRYPTPTYSL
jgi:hypothetical protein